jgi:predicted acyltransferase
MEFCMSVDAASTAAKPPRIRVESIDALRGLTIALMIFVIAVAAGNYPDLPQKASWFGSLPVSTWNHADVGWEKFAEEKSVAGMNAAEIAALPEARLQNIGLTVTDLVAPFFIFVVGLVIPLSKSRRGSEWWRHVFSRTARLILAGVIYISLVLGLSWWWGILQAIGIAYLMGSASMKLKPSLRWAAIFGVLGLHMLLSQYAGWWLQFGHTAEPFWRISAPTGSWARPLTVHCLPWVSISYGAMTMIGVLLGEAIATGQKRAIVKKSLLIAGVFMALGLALHQLGFIIGNMKLCFNKPDVTASYAMFTSGLAALFFLILYYIIDVLGYKKWAWPLVEFGKNALLAYFLQIIMRLGFRASHLEYFFAGAANDATRAWASLLGSPLNALLLDKSGYHGVFWGVLWTACLWFIVRWCNKRELYWKL